MTLSLVSWLSTSWAPCVRRRASEHTAQHLHTVAVGSSVRTVRDVQIRDSQLFANIISRSGGFFGRMR